MESIPSPKALGKANQAPDLSPSLDSLIPTFGVWRGLPATLTPEEAARLPRAGAEMWTPAT